MNSCIEGKGRRRAKRMSGKVRREQIAGAALSVIAARGVSAMTVERVARLVGLTPSGLYRHFEGKAEILDAVLEMVVGAILETIRIARQESPDPVSALQRILVDITNLIKDHFGVPRLIFSDEIHVHFPELNAKLIEIVSGISREVAKVAAQGQEEGVIRRDMTPEDIGIMFLGLFQPSGLMYYLSNKKFDMMNQVGKAWTFFEENITPRQ